MSDFIPANSLEIAMRNMIRVKHTNSWTFYTPLGSSRFTRMDSSHAAMVIALYGRRAHLS